MTYWTAPAASGPATRMAATIAATPAAFVKTVAVCASLAAAGALVAAAPALAQQPDAAAPAAPKKKPAPKPKPQAESSADAAAGSSPGAGPAAAPGPVAGAGWPARPAGTSTERPAAGAVDLLALDQILPQGPAQTPDPNAKEVCFTGKDARVESGLPVAAAVLIEPEGADKKLLRVTLPLGMQLAHGTRVIVDQNQPMTAPYVICFSNGCMADYEAIGRSDRQNEERARASSSRPSTPTGQPISLVMPLNDFGKAYDGPPTDPKVFEEQQKKLQEELQRRADEARKKLESSRAARRPRRPTAANGKTQ